MRTKLAPLVAALGTLAAWACTSLTSPESPPLTGVIVQSGPGLWSGDTDGPFQIWVKEDPEERCGIIFRVDEDTRIYDSRGGRARRADADILSDGALVAVRYELVLTSCPGQSYAESVARTE